MKILIERAGLEDITDLIRVRNESFYADFLKYGYCPGYGHTKESMEQSFLNNIFYKIVESGKIIGNISGRMDSKTGFYIGCLAIIPSYQNRGIGKMALSFLENEFPSVYKWNLKTPIDNERNLHFYQKCGFYIVRSLMDGPVKLAWLEKDKG